MPLSDIILQRRTMTLSTTRRCQS